MRKLKYVELFENFKMNEGVFDLFSSKNTQEEETKDFKRDLQELKKDKNVLFLKELGTNTKYTYVVEIKSVKSDEITFTSHTPYRNRSETGIADGDLRWTFEVRPITTIDGERIGLPHGTTKITKQMNSDLSSYEIVVDFTDAFPFAVKPEDDFRPDWNKKTIYYKGRFSNQEYEVDEDDMTKILTLCKENDKNGVFKKLMNVDIDFGDLNVGNFMESRRYKRYLRR